MILKKLDYIVVGTGPSAAAWLRQTLKVLPSAKILVLEQGPLSKTDILTEINPVKLWLASKQQLKEYQHQVFQGSCAGGGSAVNNYAWVSPSQADLERGFGKDFVDQIDTGLLAKTFSELADKLAYKHPIHMLHRHLTCKAPSDIHRRCSSSVFAPRESQSNLQSPADNASTVENLRQQHQNQKQKQKPNRTPRAQKEEQSGGMIQSNRSSLVIGTPTLDGNGLRRSAWTGIIEPLWREHFANVDILTNTAVKSVIFDDNENNESQIIGESVGPSENNNDGQPSSIPRAIGVETWDGKTLMADRVVLCGGALETPAILLRSGIGPENVLNEHDIQALKVNKDVGRNLHDKMLTDDMLITDDKSSNADFGKSLFLINGIMPDGTSFQLHRYQKLSFGNSYLAISRLIRGCGLIPGIINSIKYLTSGTVLCFQCNFKMKSPATITLDTSLQAKLDASAMFQEAQDQRQEFSKRLHDLYSFVSNMIDEDKLKTYFCVKDILKNPHKHLRMVWHFAGSCSADKVVNLDDFSVIGTRNLHIADNSVPKVCPDGGGMPMAYMVGTTAAFQMHQHSQSNQK